MISCREVTREIAGDEQRPRSMWQALQLRLHLILCRHCAEYARQIRALGATTREIFARPEGEEAVAEREALTRLKRSIVAKSRPSDEPL